MAVKSTFPKLNIGDNPTGCCPRFTPEGWDNQVFNLSGKQFVRTTTRSIFYMPLNMGSMMKQTWERINKAKADYKDQFVMLSHDISPWTCEHYLLVSKNVPGMENTKIKGKFRTKLFEGPYQDAPKADYLYYTTCPKCAKVYGKNYVVAFAKV